MNDNEQPLDWKQAEQHLEMVEKAVRDLAAMPGVNMLFYAGAVSEIRSQFDDGVRTRELYDRILELG